MVMAKRPERSTMRSAMRSKERQVTLLPNSVHRRTQWQPAHSRSPSQQIAGVGSNKRAAFKGSVRLATRATESIHAPNTGPDRNHGQTAKPWSRRKPFKSQKVLFGTPNAFRPNLNDQGLDRFFTSIQAASNQTSRTCRL